MDQIWANWPLAQGTTLAQLRKRSKKFVKIMGTLIWQCVSVQENDVTQMCETLNQINPIEKGSE